MADPGAAALKVLVQEMRADREAMARHVNVIADALSRSPWADESPTLSVVAVAVHHYYGAVESIFERVARVFEGPPERSDRWHQEPLERMTLVLDDVRPAVIRRETSQALSTVLGFRHFFRHAYAVSFDPRRLKLGGGARVSGAVSSPDDRHAPNACSSRLRPARRLRIAR